jgi:hypothetical protein
MMALAVLAAGVLARSTPQAPPTDLRDNSPRRPGSNKE